MSFCLESLVKMKKIKFYSDMHEMEEERIKEIWRMSHEDRIKSAVEMIKRFYPVGNKISEKKKIYIRK